MRIVILDNLRSAWNVGSVFRTAAALNYQELALCGVTMTPPSVKLKETSRGMEDHVSWVAYEQTQDAICHYRQQGYEIVALESGVDALPAQSWTSKPKVAWVLGNEAQGMSQEILSLVDHVVELPIKSSQASINVACAFSAMAYLDLTFTLKI
jgi:tRNA G18 (ribose-2'-O)-methylase SpoU